MIDNIYQSHVENSPYFVQVAEYKDTMLELASSTTTWGRHFFQLPGSTS